MLLVCHEIPGEFSAKELTCTMSRLFLLYGWFVVGVCFVCWLVFVLLLFSSCCCFVVCVVVVVVVVVCV